MLWQTSQPVDGVRRVLPGRVWLRHFGTLYMFFQSARSHPLLSAKLGHSEFTGLPIFGISCIFTSLTSAWEVSRHSDTLVFQWDCDRICLLFSVFMRIIRTSADLLLTDFIKRIDQIYQLTVLSLKMEWVLDAELQFFPAEKHRCFTSNVSNEEMQHFFSFRQST